MPTDPGGRGHEPRPLKEHRRAFIGFTSIELTSRHEDFLKKAHTIIIRRRNILHFIVKEEGPANSPPAKSGTAARSCCTDRRHGVRMNRKVQRQHTNSRQKGDTGRLPILERPSLKPHERAVGEPPRSHRASSRCNIASSTSSPSCTDWNVKMLVDVTTGLQTRTPSISHTQCLTKIHPPPAIAGHFTAGDSSLRVLFTLLTVKISRRVRGVRTPPGLDWCALLIHSFTASLDARHSVRLDGGAATGLCTPQGPPARHEGGYPLKY